MNVCDAGRKGIAVSTAVVEFQGVGMSDQQNGHHQSSDVSASSAGVSTSRRKLVRAGLAAAPVVAAFKTNMVLASGTNQVVSPSTFASFKNNGSMCSVTAPQRSSKSYVPMVDCARENGTDYNKLKFGFGDNKDGRNGCGFRGRAGEDYEDRELWELCAKKYGEREGKYGEREGKKGGYAQRNSDRDDLARYVAAAYISCLEYGHDAFLSREQCVSIWNGNGEWSPNAGGKPWSRKETFEYFEMVYGAKSFDNCLTS